MQLVETENESQQISNKEKELMKKAQELEAEMLNIKKAKIDVVVK